MPGFFPRHPRDPDRPAARLAVGVWLALAVALVGAALLGTRLDLGGRGANRAPAAPDDRAATRPAGSSTDGRGGPAVAGTGESGPIAADDGPGGSGRGDPDGRRDDGPAASDGRRPDPGAEQLLTLLSEFERHLDAAMARARESVVALEYTAGHAAAGRRRMASGVVINAGEILSVRIDPPPADPGPGAAGRKGRPPAPIVARDYLGHRHAARWVAADPHTGLTLLRVSPRAVRPIRPATEGPKLGSQVCVLGNPFGLGHSVNRGHIAGLDRALELGTRQLGGLIQVQAPLYPGDSGAAVVDIRGRLLGLIRGGLALRGAVRPAAGGRAVGVAPVPAAADRRDAAADVADPELDTDFGFAIPTSVALWVADQLRTHGRVDRAYLGVGLETVPVSEAEGPVASAEPSVAPESAQEGSWRGAGGIPMKPAEAKSPASAAADPASMAGGGARVREVVAGTPAARAGLRPGDRIVALDGQPIRSRNELIDRLDRLPARTEVVLGIVRAGEPAGRPLDVTVRTASRSGQPGPGPVTGRGSAPAPGPESARVSVPVTPTASHTESATRSPAQAPAASSGPGPSAPGTVEARPEPGPGEGPSAGPRRDAVPAPAPVPDRPEPRPAVAGSLDDLKLTLPRSVVERIEHLERRINQLEHTRAGPAPGLATGPAPGPADAPHGPEARADAPGPGRDREPLARPPAPPNR